MANTTISYIGDGIQRDFAVSFPYLSRAHVRVLVDEALADFSWISGATVRILPTPAYGAAIRIYRWTASEDPVVEFQSGAAFSGDHLNLAIRQCLFVAQESSDRVSGDTLPQLEIALRTASQAADTASAARDDVVEARDEVAADRASVASDYADVVVARNEAVAAAELTASRAVTYSAASWSQLAAITPTMVGQRAVVSDADAGTHTGRTATSPSTAVAGVPNAGAYGAYALAPGAWRRDGAALDEQLDDMRRAVVLTSPEPRLRVVTDRGMILDGDLVGAAAAARALSSRMPANETGSVRIVTPRGMVLEDDLVGTTAAIRSLSVGPLSNLAINETGSVRIVTPRGMVLRDLLTVPGVPEEWTGLPAQSVRQMPRWRKALARMAQGLGNARVLIVGDSNAVGWYAGPSAQHLCAYAWPTVMARLLERTVGAESASWFGNTLTSTAVSDISAYDPRRGFTSGWSHVGGASLGGNILENGSTSTPFTFNPGIIWDRADIYVALTDIATFSLGIGGATTTYSPPTNTITKIVYNAPRGANTLEIRRISGYINVLGMHCYDTATPRISVLNAGRSGWRTTDWADAGFFRRPLPAIRALAPDLSIIALGLNDLNQQVAPSVTRTALQAIVSTARESGDVMLVISSPPDDSSKSIKWAEYADVMKEVSTEYNLVLVDLTKRYGSYAAATVDGFAYDALHPGIYGYGDCAWMMADSLTKF